MRFWLYNQITVQCQILVSPLDILYVLNICSKKIVYLGNSLIPEFKKKFTLKYNLLHICIYVQQGYIRQHSDNILVQHNYIIPPYDFFCIEKMYLNIQIFTEFLAFYKMHCLYQEGVKLFCCFHILPQSLLMAVDLCTTLDLV